MLRTLQESDEELIVMDMSVLLQAKQKTQARDHKRQYQSQSVYDKGRELIREIIYNGNVDRHKFQRAVDYFTYGIQANRQNPDNYAALGYLFFVVDEPVQALKFLNEALEIAPQSPMAQELKQYIVESTQQTQNKASSQINLRSMTLPQVTENIDYDQLYDRLEMQIVVCLKHIMSDEIHQFKPNPSISQLERLQERHHEYAQVLAQLQKQVQIVDEEIDATELIKSLLMIEKALKQIFDLMQVFQEFFCIMSLISKYVTLTQTIMQEAQSSNDPEDLPILEENLELLLDQCDALANQLDALDEKGHSIAPLEPPYEGYIRTLELFQETLEDTQLRLHQILNKGNL